MQLPQQPQGEKRATLPPSHTMWGGSYKIRQKNVVLRLTVREFCNYSRKRTTAMRGTKQRRGGQEGIITW